MSSTVTPRRRRWPKVLFVLIVLFLLVVWFAPTIVAKSGLKDRVIRMATADLKGRVTVDSMSLGWFSPIDVSGLTIFDEAGNDVANVRRVVSSKSLLSLVRSRADLGQFTIESPTVTFVVSKDSSNVETILAKYLEPSDKKTARPAIGAVVTNGTVTIRDEITKGVRKLESIACDVTVPALANGPISIAFSASIPDAILPGRATANGTVGEGGQATVECKELPLDFVGWIARRFEPGLSLRGTASGSVVLSTNRNTVGIEGTVSAHDFVAANDRFGGDAFASRSVELPLSLTFEDSILTAKKLNLAFDAGTASFVGQIDFAKSPERWLEQPGMLAAVDLDVAKLPAILPSIRKSLEGTDIKLGAVKLSLASTATPDGTSWSGTFGATTVNAIRGGRSIVWDTPVKGEFAGRVGKDGVPAFDKLQIASDFIGLNFRGSWDQFEAAANLDLDRLTAHLADFADLGGLSLAGRASLVGWNRPGENGAMSLSGKATVERFAVTDGKSLTWKEPTLTIEAIAAAKREANGAIRINHGSATLLAAGDTASIALDQAIPDIRNLAAGGGKIAISGEVGRWRTRLATLYALPAEWQTSGIVQATASVNFSETGAIAENADIAVTQLFFHGMGLLANEPQVRAKVESISWDRAKGDVTMKGGKIGSETGAGEFATFAIRPSASAVPTMEGTVKITAVRLNRLATTIGLSTDPRGSDAMDGVAKGTVAFLPANGLVDLDIRLNVEQFRYGNPQNPTWTEPKIDLMAKGRFDPSSDSISFTSARIAIDGLQADGKGTVSKLSSTIDLDLSGTLNYDLAKIEPQVKGYLGKGGALAGKDSRPFRIAGSLVNGPNQLAVNVGSSSSFAKVNGDASVGWQSMRAYGFDVGAADLKANLEKSLVSFQPVRATFGTGRIDTTPSLSLNAGAYDLTFSKGRMIEKARLTPAVCSDALGYALPAIANSTEAEGLISVDWDEGRIPLADYTKMAAKGKLIMHTVKLTPGPVIRELLTVAGVADTTFALANEQVVSVWVEKGRVHHKDFNLGAKNFSIRTNGSVGFDGTLQLVCEMPFPAKALDQAFKNNPKIRDAMSKRTISVTLGGTVNRPTLDGKAFQATLQKMIGEVAKDAVKDAAGDLLKKQLDQGLEKLFPKPPMKKP